MTDISPSDLEEAYETLASAIDKAGPEKETLLLTKLALILAQRIACIDTFQDALNIAAQDLHIEPQPLGAVED